MTNYFTALFEIKKFSQASVFSCLKIFLGLSHFFPDSEDIHPFFKRQIPLSKTYNRHSLSAEINLF